MRKNDGMFRFAFVLMIAFGLTMMIAPALYADEAKVGSTLENLQAAFNGESNAHAKYQAYAKKATEEGYLKVAALFRAAAAAEEIHFNNHAAVIKSMGATPKAEIKVPAINSTKENLAEAIKGETYEQTVMYPSFLAQAEKEHNSDAIQTFNYAKTAEGEHAKLYKKALSNLNDWKVADIGFFVCPTCGYTVEGKPTFKDCPVCATPANDFKRVS